MACFLGFALSVPLSGMRFCTCAPLATPCARTKTLSSALSVLLTWMARSADSSILTGIGAAWAIDAHAKAERQASIDRRGVAGFIAENSSERTGRRIDCRRQNNRCIKLDRRLARAG